MISKDSVIVKQWKNAQKINFNQVLQNSINKNKKPIIDAQKAQLEFGLDNEGKKIKPQYHSDSYASKKSDLNSLPGFGTPDLKLSGDMYNNLDLLTGVPNDNEYSIFSDVDYFSSLNERYETAFGLSKKTIKKSVPEVNNDTLETVHKLLNK